MRDRTWPTVRVVASVVVAAFVGFVATIFLVSLFLVAADWPWLFAAGIGGAAVPFYVVGKRLNGWLENTLKCDDCAASWLYGFGGRV